MRIRRGESSPVVRTLARRELKRIKPTLAKVSAKATTDPALTLDPYTQGHIEALTGLADRALAAGYQLGR